MRRANGNSENNPYLQAGLATGYLCRRTEEDLNAIAAAAGGVVPAHQLGGWMGKFLLSKASGELLDSPQHLPQVRGGATQGHALAAAAAQVHVHPRRNLSLTARASIARAQRKRWRLQKKAARLARKAERTTPGTSWAAFKTPEARSKEMMRRRALRAGAKPDKQRAQAASTYWARLSPSQRKGEMQRRAKVRKANAAKAAKVHAPAGANGAAVAA